MYMPFTYYPFAQTEMILAKYRPTAKVTFPFAPLDEVFVNVVSVFDKFPKGYIVDYYWISNYGRLYNSHTNAFVNCHINHNGYIIGSLMLNKDVVPKELYNSRHSVNTGIHGLVCLAFIGPRPSPIHIPNHKDCNRANNYYTNLEWVTPKENTQYAYKMGNLGYGEDNTYAIRSNSEIHDVCRMLEAGFNYDDISAVVFGTSTTQDLYYLYQDIRRRHAWLVVSDNYNIPPVEEKIFTPPEVIHKICAYLQANPNDVELGDTQILINSGVDDGTLTKRQKNTYRSVSSQIRKKTAYKDIISQYNFPTKL